MTTNTVRERKFPIGERVWVDAERPQNQGAATVVEHPKDFPASVTVRFDDDQRRRVVPMRILLLIGWPAPEPTPSPR